MQVFEMESSMPFKLIEYLIVTFDGSITKMTTLGIEAAPLNRDSEAVTTYRPTLPLVQSNQLADSEACILQIIFEYIGL